MTSSDSETNTKTSTISLGAYVSFEHDINFLGIHLGTIEAETEFTHGWTTETEDTSTIAQTVEYGSIGGQDTVALYSIPMDVYVYDAYVPNGDGTYNEQTMTVNLPYNAVIKTLTLSDYDAVAADYDALPQIGGTILTHTLGDPASYPKSTAGLTNVNLPAGDFASVGYGEGGYIKQSLEMDSKPAGAPVKAMRSPSRWERVSEISPWGSPPAMSPVRARLPPAWTANLFRYGCQHA